MTDFSNLRQTVINTKAEIGKVSENLDYSKKKRKSKTVEFITDRWQNSQELIRAWTE